MTFGPLRIDHDERVLEPRPWTAAQSYWAAEIASSAPAGPVLELCCGAGQIGLLAVLGSGRQLVCVDADEVACDFARANAMAAGIAERVEVRCGRLEEVVGEHETYPLVIADPPWVPRSQTGQFPQDPLTAIDGGHDGLDVARACLDVVSRHLAPGGAAVLQLGTAAQAERLDEQHLRDDETLRLVEVRQHPRGVLVRIDRPASG